MPLQPQYRAILERFLPADAVDWVADYISRHDIRMLISRSRTSKLGDYRWPQPRHPFHEISVNGDLNPYLFFWVFLHEAAHLEVHLAGIKTTPHGSAWQEAYARLLLTHCRIFPPEVQPLIGHYATTLPLKPSLTRSIEDTLRHYGQCGTPATRLDDLPAGSVFLLKSHRSRTFRSLEKRRTRWLCEDLATGRRYTVSALAEVVAANPPS